jgi:serine/threonine protein kinase
MTNLVLYSLEDDAWKIADFGLTAEGTSYRVRSTHDAKGTNSYRAPELIKEYASYNNKVDIWALGCILYELVCEEKAFASDGQVIEWSYLKEEKKIPLSAPIDEASKRLLLQLICDTLNREAEARPSARNLSTTLAAFFGHSPLVDSPERSSIIRTEHGPDLQESRSATISG